MTENTPSPVPVLRRAPRWMWSVLILSLAFNLLVLGAAAGAIWHFRHGHDLPHRGPDGLARFMRTLPAERRDTIASLIEAERDKTRRLRHISREGYRDVARAFGADPFDADRFQAAARAVSEARIALIRHREVFFSTIATKLTSEERRAYLEWRRDRRRHRWHHRHWNDRNGGSRRGDDE